MLKEYSKRHAAHRPLKDKEHRSIGNKKRAKTVKSDGKTQEVNTVESRDETILRKKKEKPEEKA